MSPFYLSYTKYMVTSNRYNRSKRGIKLCLNASFHGGFKRCSATFPRPTLKFSIVQLCFEASTPFKEAPGKGTPDSAPHYVVPSCAVPALVRDNGRPLRSAAYTTRVCWRSPMRSKRRGAQTSCLQRSTRFCFPPHTDCQRVPPSG